MISQNLLRQYESIIISLSTVVLSKTEGVQPVIQNKKLFGKQNKSVEVFFDKDDSSVTIDVSINVKTDVKVPDVSFKIQQGIIKDVESATMFKVKAVNVKVIEVIF